MMPPQVLGVECLNYKKKYLALQFDKKNIVGIEVNINCMEQTPKMSVSFLKQLQN